MPIIGSALSPNVSRQKRSRKSSVSSAGGIVVSQNRAASEVGARVLKAGGSATDAAIATAFAIGVLEPWMSGIGGVGSALALDAATGKVTGFDFGGRAPLGLKVEDFKLTGSGRDSNLFGWPIVEGNINTVGPKSFVAPTQPAGLALMHKALGRHAWRDLLAPAIALADEGPVVDWYTTLQIASAFADLARDPGARARFLPGGAPLTAPPAAMAAPPVRYPMPDLARTLRILADEGVDALYRGAVGQALIEDVSAMGGYLAKADLETVEAEIRQPLAIAYRGRTIHVLPELNGGPTLAVGFADLLQRMPDPPKSSAPDGKTFVAYTEALRAAWAHRLEVMGDAGERTAPTCTTHIAVVDKHGNVVTLTQTLLSIFGSRVVLPKTGILMNNGMNWFDPRPGGPNSLAPGRRGLANFVPAIMTGGNEVWGIGGCGGRRIIPAVFQLLAMGADFGFDLDRAFHEPRVDVSGGPVVIADRRLAEPALRALASAFDVTLAEADPGSMTFTIATAVRRNGVVNEAATEPEHPWSDAVTEDEV